jgi:hypothetical protein
MAHRASTQREGMTELWAQVSSPAMRPFVTLFFEVFGLVAQARRAPRAARGPHPAVAPRRGRRRRRGSRPATGTRRPAAGIAVIRGLLLELVAGAEPAEIDAAYRPFVDRSAGPEAP